MTRGEFHRGLAGNPKLSNGDFNASSPSDGLPTCKLERNHSASGRTRLRKMFRARLSHRTRKRTLLLAAGLFLFYLYYLRPSWGDREPLESATLEQHMNHDPPPDHPDRSDGFDWSKVAFEHPPPARIQPLRPRPPSSSRSTPQQPPPPVQAAFKRESASRAAARNCRRDEVKALFRRNWAAYRAHAWGRDALLPLSRGGRDQLWCGWAATLVDSLDTLWIMGLREEFDEAVAYVAREVDFGTCAGGAGASAGDEQRGVAVNIFETNIRYLGGLLAAYDLSRRPVLLRKAVQVGDLLYAAFNTPNRMPVGSIDFEAAKTGRGLEAEEHVVSASPGSLVLELTRLSQVTGDAKYYDAAARVMDVFAEGQPRTRIPGLWPTMVSMQRMDVTTGDRFTVGGGADSLYEYLPKMAALLGPGTERERYRDMSEMFLDAANVALLYRPMLPGREDVLMAGTARLNPGSPRVLLDAETEHLSCFLGGAYALAGRLFHRPREVVLGEKLAKGCIYSYRAMPSGIGPERWNMVACADRKKCPWDKKKWKQGTAARREWREGLPKGFTTVKDPRYMLRPEAIESVFVLYRVTGRYEYQQAAWEMFQAVANGTATDIASAAVTDVTARGYPLPQEDYIEVRSCLLSVLSTLLC